MERSITKAPDPMVLTGQGPDKPYLVQIPAEVESTPIKGGHSER